MIVAACLAVWLGAVVYAFTHDFAWQACVVAIVAGVIAGWRIGIAYTTKRWGRR